MEKKVSIIVPCYNVSETIDECMEMLVAQTIGIENLEIIFVNDASTDDCLDKLCHWEQQYPDSVLVVNCTENGGPGQARNIGIQYASAPYIGFADDDDICKPHMYATLYDAAITHNCDLVVCQSVRQHDVFQAVADSANDDMDEILCIDNFEMRVKLLDHDINNAVWNKLYARSLLIDNQLQFPTGMFYEDISFSQLVKQYCKKVYICKKILYHHIVRTSSISRTQNPEKRLGYLQAHIILIEELRARNIYEAFAPYYDELFIVEYVNFMINYEELLGKPSAELKQVILESIQMLFPNLHEIPAVSLLQNSKYPEVQELAKELSEL